jgi:signal peptidase I
MDTDAYFSERDRSDTPREGGEQRSRSLRIPGQERCSRLRRPGCWRRVAWLAAACAAFLVLLNAFVVQPFLIPSGSMEPTLRVGDRVLVNKVAYRFGGKPRRGDVVVFDGAGSFVHGETEENPVTGLLRKAAAAIGLAEPDETDYVKRVIGVGGDRVACCDERGRITVNGEAIDEPYLYPGDAPSQVPFDIVVPDGRLWVLGDHRSTEPGGGMVPVERVIGRADWICWPYHRWTTIDQGPGQDDAHPAGQEHGHTYGKVHAHG